MKTKQKTCKLRRKHDKIIKKMNYRELTTEKNVESRKRRKRREKQDEICKESYTT